MNTVPLYLEKDLSSINRLFLMLGPACNMQCRHCVEAPQKEILPVLGLNHLDINISDKVLLLMENFIKSLDRNNEKRKVIFWGGEPLLYWNTICKVVEYLLERCKNFNFSFAITTNGLLLTDEKIKFLNKYNFLVHLSYDAPYPFAVRGYISDKICEKAKEIKGLRILTGYSAYNCDPLLAYNCLAKKFPNIPIDFSVFLGHSFDMPKDIYCWDWDRINNALRKLRIASQLGDKVAFMYLRNNFGLGRKTNIWDNKIEYLGLRKKCVAGYDKLCVTPLGDVTNCHISTKIVGNIYDSLDSLKEKAYKYTVLQGSNQCKSCRHLALCGSNRCCLNLKEQDGSYVFCNNYYLHFFDILKKELLELTKPLSDADKVWFFHEKEIMNQQVEKFLLEGQRYEKEHTGIPIDYLN